MNFQQIQALRQLNAVRVENAILAAGSDSQRLQAQYRDHMEVLNQVLRFGESVSLSAEQRTIKNAMSTTTGTQGGYTVPSPVALSIADALNQFSSVRRMGTVVVTAAGQNLPYPSSDGRSEVGEQLDQNQLAGSADIGFGGVAWNAFNYSSKLISVPVQLIQDSSIDIVGLIERRIAARIGRITNAKFTTGAGTTEPMGVVTAATVGKAGATGQTTTVTSDDLEDLVGSVDAAYRESPQCGWMMNDVTLRAIAKLKDSTGRPLKLVKYGNPRTGEPATLLNFPVESNPDMPSMAANAKSILFGDFSSYVIRDVAQTAIHRFEDSAFALKGQVGFVGMSRHGGAYVDAGGAIKAYQNSAT